MTTDESGMMMHTIMVPDHIFDGVIKAIEHAYPNATVREFPKPWWASEAVPEHFITPRTMADRCDPALGYHTTPHRGCIMR